MYKYMCKVTASTLATRPKDCKTESTNMDLNQPDSHEERQAPLQKCRLTTSPECDSAIGHLLENQDSAATYNDNYFTVLAAVRFSFHLVILEATFIKTKNLHFAIKKNLPMHYNSSTSVWISENGKMQLFQSLAGYK